MQASVGQLQGAPPVPIARPRTPEAGVAHGAKPRKPDALLYSILVLSWALIWRVQDLIPGLARIKFVFLALIVSAIIAATAPKGGRQLPSTKSPIVKLLLALCGLAVLGVPFSLYRSMSLVYVFYEILPHLEFVLLVAYAIRSADDVNWLAFWHMVGAAVYSMIIYVRFPVQSNGRLGELVFYDTNDFGLMLVCTIPFAVYFMRPGVSIRRRLTALICLGIMLRMLILTGSRGGFVGLIVVMAYLAVSFRAVPLRLRVGAVVIAVAIFGLLGSQRYWAMIDTVLHPATDYNWVGGDPTGRMEIWKRGLGYMAARPVLGVGMGAFQVAEGTLSDISRQYAAEGMGLKWSVAHNMYIEVGAELGVPALFCFVGILALSLGTLRTVQKRTGRHGGSVAREDFAQALTGSMIGYIVCGFFLSAEHFAYFYFVLGLILAQEVLSRRRVSSAAETTTPARRLRPTTRLTPQWSPSGT